MTEPARGETENGDGDNSTSLASQVADWQPPWQRPVPTDTPVDEPVGHADPVPDGVGTVDQESARESQPPTDPTPRAAPRPQPDPLPLPNDLAGTLEAILLVCEEPVSQTVLAQTLGRTEAEIVDVLRRLAAEYTGDNRGFELRQQAGGWRYYTREEFAPFVERFVLDGQQVRLTKAALETLAVVAYRQPVTRGRISAIRGVNCDGVIRTLTNRGLIEECGSEPESGAHLYRTTSMFLEKLGVNSVDDLPPLAPLLPDNLDEIGDGDDG